MGVDLFTIGNHTIQFRHRQFKNISKEICERLNSIEFPNAEYLHLRRLFEVNNSHNRPINVRKINTLKECRTECADLGFRKYDKSIIIEGPFGLSLDVCKSTVLYRNPAIRYWQWFSANPWDGYYETVNEWRKYYALVQRALGGNKVVYTGDCGLHFDRYFDPNLSFDEYEQILSTYYTLKKNFTEVANDIDNTFLVDNFEDVDWDLHYPLEEYLPEPDDRDNTNLDINEFGTLQQLLGYYFDEEVLLHKEVDDQIHFCHLLRFQGVLVKQTGIIGEIGKMETFLDEYATFTYEELEKQLEGNGYGNGAMKNFLFYFRSTNYEYAWRIALEAFYAFLKWYGIGDGHPFNRSNRVASHIVYAVNENMMLHIIKVVRQIFRIKQPLEIYRYNDFRKKERIDEFNPIDTLDAGGISEKFNKDLIDHILFLKNILEDTEE